MAKANAKRDDDTALDTMRSRYARAEEVARAPYDEARDDIKFITVPGNQWDRELLERRKGRPTLEFPKLRMHAQTVINEIRQSRPQGKVRGVEESDRGLAEIMQGLCRNIESTSNAALAYDVAVEKAVKGGFGVFRICTDYLNDDDFEQDIRIKPIRNPFSVKFDPAAVELDRRDANFCFVADLMSREDFERKYPDADMQDFGDDRDTKDWRDAGQVRVAEYWYKKPVKRERWALSTGEIVWKDELGIEDETQLPEGTTVTARRVVESKKVCMRLTNGREWLTDEYEFPSKFIPIVPVWGNIEDIDGSDYFCGIVRHAKDQQKLHNVHRSALVEAVAKAPKAPFILKLGWIKGLEKYWKRANSEDFPYLPVRDDAPDNAMPQRTQQAEVPAALIQLAGMDNDDMKAATGQYDASLGARSNETSGVAINSRKQQGATSSFNYIDNLAYAVRYAYEILVDMIPRVYDTPRVVRILGEDGAAKWKQLYQEVTAEDGSKHVINDIRKGKYDTTVTVGPSYATQRMEAAEGFTQLAGQIGSSAPGLGPLLAYGAVKNLDLPGMEEIDKALRKTLIAQGLIEPGEGDQPPEPQKPDPEKEAKARKLAADASLSEARAQNEAALGPVELQKLVAETVRLTLQNIQAGAGALPMPGPMPPGAMPQQLPPPPQGGFFMPADDATATQQPQFTG